MCYWYFGTIKLILSVFHFGFFRSTIQVLQCVCKNCHRLLLSDSEREPFLMKMRNPLSDTVIRDNLLRIIVTTCKKHYDCCPHCNSVNGSIKQYEVLHLIHEKYKMNSNNTEIKDFYLQFNDTINMNKISKIILIYLKKN